MDLSIIIVNWNTKYLIENCLKSIYKFTKGIQFEIIFVDNGSSDGSADLVRQKFPEVKIIANKNNLGFTKANNQGIKSSNGKYILLLNSDTYLIENSFKKMLTKAENISKFGVLGPQLLNEDKTIQQSVGYFPNLLKIFYWITFIDDLPGGAYLKPYHVDHDSFYKSDKNVDWVTGAALLTSKEVVLNFGALDEKIFMYGEDVDFCYRIKKGGFKVIFSPTTQIIHIGGGSHNKVRDKAFMGEYEGLKYIYKKYNNNLSLQILRLFLKIGALLRIIVFFLIARASLSKAYVKVFKVA